MQDAASGALRIKNMTGEGKKARKCREDENKKQYQVMLIALGSCQTQES